MRYIWHMALPRTSCWWSDDYYLATNAKEKQHQYFWNNLTHLVQPQWIWPFKHVYTFFAFWTSLDYILHQTFLVGSANLHPRNQSSKSPQATLESSTLKPWHPTAAMAKPCRPGCCWTQPRPISCGESQVGVSKFVEVGVFGWRWAICSNWLVGVLLDLVCMNELSKLMMFCVSFFGIFWRSDLGSANVHKGNVGWTQGDFILNYRNW